MSAAPTPALASPRSIAIEEIRIRQATRSSFLFDRMGASVFEPTFEYNPWASDRERAISGDEIARIRLDQYLPKNGPVSLWRHLASTERTEEAL